MPPSIGMVLCWLIGKLHKYTVLNAPTQTSPKEIPILSMKKLIQSYWILLVLPSLTRFVLRIVFETTRNTVCKTTSENFPRQGPSWLQPIWPQRPPPSSCPRSDQILSSCETSVGKSLQSILPVKACKKFLFKKMLNCGGRCLQLILKKNMNIHNIPLHMFLFWALQLPNSILS